MYVIFLCSRAIFSSLLKRMDRLTNYFFVCLTS